MCPRCRLWGMLEEIPSIFFPSLCRSLNLLHHDSMRNPKPDEEIQKFHPKSSSTYTSAGATREFQREEVKQDLSRQIYWDLEHRLRNGGGHPLPPPHYQAQSPGELGAVLPTTSRLIWLLCPGFKTTTLLAHILVAMKQRDGVQRVWDLDTDRPGFAFYLCRLWAVALYTHYWTALWLSLLIKMKIIVSDTRLLGELEIMHTNVPNNSA